MMSPSQLHAVFVVHLEDAVEEISNKKLRNNN